MYLQVEAAVSMFQVRWYRPFGKSVPESQYSKVSKVIGVGVDFDSRITSARPGLSELLEEAIIDGVQVFYVLIDTGFSFLIYSAAL